MPKHSLFAAVSIVTVFMFNLEPSVFAQGNDPPCPFKRLFFFDGFNVYSKCYCDEQNDCQEYEVGSETFIFADPVATGCSPTKTATGECVCNTGKMPDVDNGSGSMPRGYFKTTHLQGRLDHDSTR